MARYPLVPVLNRQQNGAYDMGAAQVMGFAVAAGKAQEQNAPSTATPCSSYHAAMRSWR